MDTKKPLLYCTDCGTTVDGIHFSAYMTEEWTWDGSHWENTARYTQTNDFQINICCSECENIIGSGSDFGFGKQFNV